MPKSPKKKKKSGKPGEDSPRASSPGRKSSSSKKTKKKSKKSEVSSSSSCGSEWDYCLTCDMIMEEVFYCPESGRCKASPWGVNRMMQIQAPTKRNVVNSTCRKCFFIALLYACRNSIAPKRFSPNRRKHWYLLSKRCLIWKSHPSRKRCVGGQNLGR